MNTTTEDSGDYELKIFNSRDYEKIFNIAVQGFSAADRDEVKRKSVMEGEPVTLDPGVMKNTNDSMMWYFNDGLIAEITGDQSQICADDQCKERFRDSSFSITRVKRFSVSVNGVSSVEVSVMEGDSVTLHTGVETSHQEKIKWYCNDTRIAQISGDLSYICTDVQCNEGTERFRDRLKLDHQTGSLNITNTTTEDSGDYKLKIINSRDYEKIFNITVQGVSAADRDEVKRKSVMEGESVTLDSGVKKNTNDSMTWYFNDVLIAEITRDQSQICADDQCKERFRDRLKLDHQTGALTITHTTNTDSGQYKLQMMINNSSFSINRVKRFSVSVTAVPGSGLSAGAVAGIVIGVLLVFAAVGTAAGIYYRHRIYTPPTAQNDDDL
ncbi:uncharacterized protein [Pseudorasbora parva]